MPGTIPKRLIIDIDLTNDEFQEPKECMGTAIAKTLHKIATSFFDCDPECNIQCVSDINGNIIGTIELTQCGDVVMLNSIRR